MEKKMTREEMIAELESLDEQKRSRDALKQYVAGLAEGAENAPASAEENVAAGFQHGLNALTFGQMPRIAGVVNPLVQKLQGVKTPETYEQAKAQEEANLIQSQKEAPIGATVGNIAGSVPSMAVGAGVATKGAQSILANYPRLSAILSPIVGETVGSGVVESIKDVPGADNTLKGKLERGYETAKTAGLMTAGMRGAAAVVPNMQKAIIGAGKRLEDFGDSQATKAITGNYLKEYKKIDNLVGEKELGKWIKSKGLIQVGQSAEDIAPGVAKIREETGKKLGDIYSRVNDFTQKASKMKGVDQVKLGMIKATPDQVADDVFSQVSKQVSGTANANKVRREAQSILENLREVSKDGPLGFSELQKFRQSVGRQARFGEGVEDVATVEAKQIVAKILRQRELDQIKAVSDIGEKIGQKGLAQQVKQLSDDFHKAALTDDAIQYNLQRSGSNRVISLTDTAAAVGGLASGGIGGANPALTAALLGAGNRAIRTRGASTAAVSAPVGADILKRIGESRLTGAVSQIGETVKGAAKAPGVAGAIASEKEKENAMNRFIEQQNKLMELRQLEEELMRRKQLGSKASIAAEAQRKARR